MKIIFIIIMLSTPIYGKGPSDGNGGYDGLGGDPGFVGPNPMNPQGGQSLDIPELNFSQSPCPFKNTRADMNTLWQGTLQVVEGLADRRNQEAQNCSGLTTSATELQQQLGEFLSMTDFDYPSCSNYRVVYSARLQSVETYAARQVNPSYVTDPNINEFIQECRNHINTEATQIYIQPGFQDCIEGLYDSKIDQWEIDCIHDETIEDLEEAEEKFNSYMNLLPAIQNNIQGLISHNCENEALAQSALVSVMDLTTSLTSTALGGVGGILSAFSGGIIIESIQAIFSHNRYRDLRQMQDEDEYNDLACFYFRSQQLYCGAEKERIYSRQETCLECVRADGLALLPNDFLKSAVDLQSMIRSSRNPNRELVDQLLEQINSEVANGETLKDFMTNEVYMTLYRHNGIEDQKLKELNDYIDALEGAKSFLDQTENLSFTEARARMQERAELEAKGQDPDPGLTQYMQIIRNFDMIGTLHEYQNITEPQQAQGFELLEQADRLEIARELSLPQPMGFDQGMWDQANAAFINSTKDIFTDNLKHHFCEAYDNYPSEPTPAASFSYIEPLIKDCLLTKGVQFIPESQGTYYTAPVERSNAFEKYCSQLECEPNGLAPFNSTGDQYSRDRFRSHQCREYQDFPQKMAAIKEQFLRNGRICNKTLEEILPRNVGRRDCTRR